MSLEVWRADTPGCAYSMHLNNAGASLMPSPVLEAVQRHLELEARHGGYEAADLATESLEGVYRAIAELLGTEPRQIALLENATAAFGRALGSIPFEAGDAIVTSEADYVSNQIMFLSLGKRFGVEVVRAADAADGSGVDPNSVEELVRQHDARLVAITHIPTYSGLIQRVEEIGAICRRHDVLYLLDACQSVGHLVLDVQALGCDFLSATGRKFLRAPRGTGFLYVSERALELGLEPLLPDLRGADWIDADRYRPRDDARRFENWEFSWANVSGLGAAVEYVLRHDQKRTSARTLQLGAYARQRLARVPGIQLLDADRPENRLGSILTLTFEGWRPEDLVHELRRHSIHTSASMRSSALLDFERRGIAGALRVSPHYYNSENEIDALADLLAELNRR